MVGEAFGVVLPWLLSFASLLANLDWMASNVGRREEGCEDDTEPFRTIALEAVVEVSSAAARRTSQSKSSHRSKDNPLEMELERDTGVTEFVPELLAPSRAVRRRRGPCKGHSSRERISAIKPTSRYTTDGSQLTVCGRVGIAARYGYCVRTALRGIAARDTVQAVLRLELFPLVWVRVSVVILKCHIRPLCLNACCCDGCVENRRALSVTPQVRRKEG